MQIIVHLKTQANGVNSDGPEKTSEETTYWPSYEKEVP